VLCAFSVKSPGLGYIFHLGSFGVKWVIDGSTISLLNLFKLKTANELKDKAQAGKSEPARYWPGKIPEGPATVKGRTLRGECAGGLAKVTLRRMTGGPVEDR